MAIEPDLLSALAEVWLLVEEYRQRCLWLRRPNCQPETVEEALRLLARS